MLVAASVFGAHCIGGDIDVRVIHGIGKTSNVFSSFDQVCVDCPPRRKSSSGIVAPLLAHAY